jgi:hypothetical protein
MTYPPPKPDALKIVKEGYSMTPIIYHLESPMGDLDEAYNGIAQVYSSEADAVLFAHAKQLLWALGRALQYVDHENSELHEKLQEVYHAAQGE